MRLLAPLLLGITGVALAAPAAPPTTPLAKATAALDALWATFWSPQAQYLLRDAGAPPAAPSAGDLLGFWNYQEATHAMALGASLDYEKYGPKLKAMIAGQAAMDSTRQPDTGTGPGPAGTDGWTRPFFDDMNWAELALLSAHEAAAAAGDADFAEGLLIGSTNTSVRNIFGGVAAGRARRPFPQTISSAWDITDCGGGVYWDRKKTQKATASNAGPALSSTLFAQTLNVTKSTDPEANWREVMAEEYTQWGAKVYSFWNSTMTDAATGQVTDHLAVHAGSCSKSSPSESFTYNEGLMVRPTNPQPFHPFLAAPRLLLNPIRLHAASEQSLLCLFAARRRDSARLRSGRCALRHPPDQCLRQACDARRAARAVR